MITNILNQTGSIRIAWAATAATAARAHALGVAGSTCALSTAIFITNYGYSHDHKPFVAVWRHTELELNGVVAP